jgi:hypothetical protein
MTGARTIDGTLLVEPNATLILDHADLVVGQALVVEGRVSSVGSTITFAGPYARHEMNVAGQADLEDTTMRGLQGLEIVGVAALRGGSVDAGCMDVAGRLDSRDVAWTFLTGPCQANGWSTSPSAPLGVRVQGEAAFEGGSIRAAGNAPAVQLDAGVLRLGNLTLDAGRSGALLDVRGGDARAWGATLRAPDLAQAVRVEGGTLRLVDAPLPRNAQPPSVGGSGRLEVLWTLTVRAQSVVGQAPAPGLNVTLAGAHDPTGVEARGVTDAKGEARLLALEYVYDGRWTQSRTGNPHAITVEGAGQRGASPAVVVEAPASVVVPVLPAPLLRLTQP